jgi:hypothetical protein
MKQVDSLHQVCINYGNGGFVLVAAAAGREIKIFFINI